VIDAILDQLLSSAIDSIRDGDGATAIETLIAARQRATEWGASVQLTDEALAAFAAEAQAE
jgi:hypothetical protein